MPPQVSGTLQKFLANGWTITQSRRATVKLTRSIPKSNKQLLKEQLGFEGYKVGELVPRLTRRATMANWLLSHMRDREIMQ
jgi:hypothetical protein